MVIVTLNIHCIIWEVYLAIWLKTCVFWEGLLWRIVKTNANCACRFVYTFVITMCYANKIMIKRWWDDFAFLNWESFDGTMWRIYSYFHCIFLSLWRKNKEYLTVASSWERTRWTKIEKHNIRIRWFLTKLWYKEVSRFELSRRPFPHNFAVFALPGPLLRHFI